MKDGIFDVIHGFFDWLMTLCFILAFMIVLVPIIFFFGGIEAVIKSLRSDVSRLPFQT